MAYFSTTSGSGRFSSGQKALDVPLYMHPAIPHQAVIDVYFKDYAKEYPSFLRAGWGFTLETATQGIRLVLSGVFDAYPNLKIILGHLGESLPFSLWRIDQALSRNDNRQMSFRKEFCEHFYITTSGNFSTPALLCCILEMGVDRILFSVDWPYVANIRRKMLKMRPCPVKTRPKSSRRMLSGCYACRTHRRVG